MSATTRGFTHLPGGELLAEGLEDLKGGVETVPALLVQIGAPRLRLLRIEVPSRPFRGLPEHRLYEILALEHGDNAHGRYNALIRKLVSLTQALACVG